MYIFLIVNWPYIDPCCSNIVLSSHSVSSHAKSTNLNLNNFLTLSFSLWLSWIPKWQNRWRRSFHHAWCMVFCWLFKVIGSTGLLISVGAVQLTFPLPYLIWHSLCYSLSCSCGSKYLQPRLILYIQCTVYEYVSFLQICALVTCKGKIQFYLVHAESKTQVRTTKDREQFGKIGETFVAHVAVN